MTEISAKQALKNVMEEICIMESEIEVLRHDNRLMQEQLSRLRRTAGRARMGSTVVGLIAGAGLMLAVMLWLG